MQDVYTTCQADRVHGAIGIARMVFHDLQDPRSAKAPMRLSIWVLFATLRYVQSEANRIFTSSGKEARSALVLPIQTTGLMLGDAIISILCLNEHKRQKIDSDCAQNSKKCDTTTARECGVFGLRLVQSGEQMLQVIENTVEGTADGPLKPQYRA